MAKVKFQGYAIGKGFSNIDPGYSALTRLQEKQNQDLANLKQAEKDRRDRDLQAEADLERVMKNEEANRKEIYIEDKVFTTRERALQVNKEIFVQNQRAKIKSIKEKDTNLQQILAFSKTALKDFETIREKDWEATMNASYNYYMTHGISLEEQLRIDLMEDELFQRGANFEAIADQLRQEGYTNEEVSYVRGKNSASDYGRLKAYSVQAGLRWQEFAISELARMGITDKVEQEAALDALRIKYLKAHKLYGVSSDFLEPMFQRMRAGTSQLLAKTQLRNDVEFTKGETNKALEKLYGFPTPDSLNNLFLTKTREINPRTGTTYSPSEAKQWIFDTLENIELFDDDQVRDLLANTKMLHMNKMWGDDVNSDFVIDLWDNRDKNRKAKERGIEAQVTQKKKELLNKAIDFFEDPLQFNGDKRVGEKVIKELRKQGFTADELDVLLPYLDQSVSGRADGDEWRALIQYSADQGTLTTEELNNPYVPRDLKIEFREQAKANDTLLKGVDMKYIEGVLGDSLKATLGEFSLDKALHDSFKLAKFAAVGEFRKAFKETGSIDKALTQVRLQIETGRYDPDRKENNGLGSGPFMVIPHHMLKTGDNRNIFATFTPGNHESAPVFVKPSRTVKERADLVLKVGMDLDSIDNELYIHPADIKQIRENILQNKSYRLPEILFDLATDYPELGSATDIWTRQLKVAHKIGRLEFTNQEGETEELNIEVEDFRKTLFRDVDDPTAKNLINNIRTKGQVLKAIQILNNPESTRDLKYMSNTVVRKLAVPSILETQLRREDMRDDPYYEYDVETGTYSQYGVE